jgi:hypothetical protein
MANTVISLLSSGESGNTPLASALADGELALNFADGIIYYKTATGSLGQFRVVEPSGLDGEIQFNDSGVFGSNASLTFDKDTGVLSTSNVTANSIATRSYIQFADGTLQFTANAGSGGGGTITVTFGTQPPTSGNTVGDQWVDANTGSKFEYIDDGDTLQWVEFGPTPFLANTAYTREETDNLFSTITYTKSETDNLLSTKQNTSPVLTTYQNEGVSFRNRIINGDMRIDQRNAGAAVTGGGSYPVDRFRINNTTDGAFSAQQDSSAPPGFTSSLKYTTTTADASLTGTQVSPIFQIIEGTNVYDLGWGTANAQPVTLSFWVRSSLTGTFGGSLRNGNANRSYPFSYSISAANTWEQKTVTIPGDTTGTWLTDNGAGIRLSFSMGSGSDSSGTAGAWNSNNHTSVTGAVSVIGTLNATWQITGVQLEAGSVATPFERRPYPDELRLCQRYYQKTYDIGVVPGTDNTNSYFVEGTFIYTTNSTWGITWRFPVEMRASPTVTFYAGTTSGSLSYAYGTATGIGAVTQFGIGTKSVGAYHNGTATGTSIGQSVMVYGHAVAVSEL